MLHARKLWGLADRKKGHQPYVINLTLNKQCNILHAKHTQENLQGLYIQFAHVSDFIGRVSRHALRMSLFPHDSLDEPVRYEPRKHVSQQLLQYRGLHAQPPAAHYHLAIIFAVLLSEK